MLYIYIYNVKFTLNDILLFYLVAHRLLLSSFYVRKVVKSRSIFSEEDFCSIFSSLS